MMLFSAIQGCLKEKKITLIVRGRNSYRILAQLIPREIHADVNTGVSLVECLCETGEREAKHEVNKFKHHSQPC